MARKSKSSAVEDVANLVAMLPWWGGVGLALVSYVFLHRMAQPPSLTGLTPGQMSAVVVGSVASGLAMIGQFLIPLICLFGALGSFLARRRRQTLASNVSQSTSADALDGMSWREFEMLVGEAFRLQGYRVTEQGGAGPDGGIDLVLSKGSEKFLVQCKQWKAFKVGVTVVRELYGVMAAKGAAGGFVVTSGRFTDEATAFASGRNIKLVDGRLLHGLLSQAKNSAGANQQASPQNYGQASSRPNSEPLPQQMAARLATPVCPSCGSSMAKRKARRGVNAGGEFWGCRTYPACKGTLDV